MRKLKNTSLLMSGTFCDVSILQQKHTLLTFLIVLAKAAEDEVSNVNSVRIVPAALQFEVQNCTLMAKAGFHSEIIKCKL